MSRIRMTFTRAELMYDIRSTAYTMADATGDAEPAKARLLRDIGEDGNKDRVTRIMDLEAARCTEELYAYTKEEAGDIELRDDILHETKEYAIEMDVKDFSKTTATLLSRLIHEYMVFRVLAEWLDMHGMDGGSAAEKTAVIMDEIQKSMMRRTRRTHTTMNFP